MLRFVVRPSRNVARAGLLLALLGHATACKKHVEPAVPDAVPNATAAQPLKKGQEFPNFSQPDLLTGKTIELAKFRGKVVLVDFWATWCGPCVKEVPNIKKAYEKYHEDGFEVISVSLDKDVDKCKSFIKDRKMDWHHICDGKSSKAELAEKHGISAIPVAVIVDKAGKILTVDARGEEFSKTVAEALGLKYDPEKADAGKMDAKAEPEAAEKPRAAKE